MTSLTWYSATLNNVASGIFPASFYKTDQVFVAPVIYTERQRGVVVVSDFKELGVKMLTAELAVACLENPQLVNDEEMLAKLDDMTQFVKL